MPKSRRPNPQLLPPEFRTRGVADIMVMRSIVGFLGIWEECGPACRRKQSCASPDVACFDHNLDPIRRYFEALARWRRLDGPRTPEEEAAPIGDGLID